MKKISKALWTVLDWFLYIGMVGMVLMVFINVVGRYVFNHSFASVEEMPASCSCGWCIWDLWWPSKRGRISGWTSC